MQIMPLNSALFLLILSTKLYEYIDGFNTI